jgi:copper chaperone CopZ
MLLFAHSVLGCYAKDKSAVEPLAQAVEQVTTEPCKKTCGPSERAIEPAVSAGCDRQLVELDPDANEVGLDDACSCCVKGLLKLATTDPGQLTKLLQPLLLLQSNAATELRECCQRFASVLGCARLACCFPVARSGERDTKQVAEMAPRVAVPHLAVAVKPSERFVRQAFNINGMDCGDCGPIVAQAARKLTGVTDVVADYVRGVLTLSYDSERMQREAVASFVARATGFDVQVVEGAVHGDSKSTPNLPLAFVTWPPDALLARFGDVVPASASASSTSAHLRLNTEYASQPRTVLDELEPFGPSLRPPEQASARARATRDLVAVGTRTVILGALAVPVLVLAWADFPESGKTARGAAAVALSACIWSGAWPIYNSALRELIVRSLLTFPPGDADRPTVLASTWL